ncbi:DUF4381 domain-containing protein [Stenotrophomonas sp. PS02289]|uniref:DUF4381 domain-containing protein n=1 Tax=Stenotrophomonas sp. PS02289 TaxID=2991422 RepID=UPI00249A6072|nr:DUF4381 domain-containing protein [Stenotrophomonas sp. PS02289]
MSAGTSLPLRDVHLPAAPGWWPLPPGWWVLLSVCAVVLIGLGLWRAHRRRVRRRWVSRFNAAVDAADAPAAQLAAISELLRRAARVRQPGAELLQGEAWLQFLEAPQTAFAEGDAALLLDGAYRRDPDPARVARLRPIACARFVQLMSGQRP